MIWASRFAAQKKLLQSRSFFCGLASGYPLHHLRAHGFAVSRFGGSATIPLAQDASQTQIKINVESYAIFLLRYAKNTLGIAFVDAFGTAARAFEASAYDFGTAVYAFEASAYAFEASVCAFGASVHAFKAAVYAFGASVHAFEASARAFGYAVLKIINFNATDF